MTMFYFSINLRLIYLILLIWNSLVKKSYLVEPGIGQTARVFVNGPGDQGSIQGRIIPKTQKMVLDANLLNTLHFQVHNQCEVEQSRERSSALSYTLVSSLLVLSWLQHGYPWPSLATPPSRSSLLADPQGYIPYPHRPAVCRFMLVALLLLGHVGGP